MINGINANQAAAQRYAVSKTKDGAGAAQKAGTQSPESGVILELGKSEDSYLSTYGKPASKAPDTAEEAANTEEKTDKLNAEEINRLWDEANKATENLRKLVEELLRSQGKSFEGVLSGKEELIVDEETRAAAAEAVSEDGECGVQAVSDRIVAFAKAISNDNPEMYDKLMAAIDEGFAQAEKAFGGKLPDICGKTREEINRKMEEWKNSKAQPEEK